MLRFLLTSRKNFVVLSLLKMYFVDFFDNFFDEMHPKSIFGIPNFTYKLNLNRTL